MFSSILTKPFGSGLLVRHFDRSDRGVSFSPSLFANSALLLLSLKLFGQFRYRDPQNATSFLQTEADILADIVVIDFPKELQILSGLGNVGSYQPHSNPSSWICGVPPRAEGHVRVFFLPVFVG